MMLIELSPIMVKEQGCYRAITKGNFDFYFPSRRHVSVFRALMQCQQTYFSSNQIKEPFRVGTIANLNSLNVDGIKLDDIIHIRFGEGAFAELRSVLREILHDIETNEGDFSDVDTEFRAIAKERCRKKLSELSEAAKKSSPLTALLDSKDKIALGVVLGLYTGHPLAGAIAGAAKPLYDILRSTSHSKGREISSLRCHYLALSFLRFLSLVHGPSLFSLLSLSYVDL